MGATSLVIDLYDSLIELKSVSMKLSLSIVIISNMTVKADKVNDILRVILYCDAHCSN